MSDQVPSAFQAALARGLVSRRTAMAGMAGVTAAAALAACGSAGKNPTAGPTASGGATNQGRVKAAADQSDAEKVVNWSNWPEYIDVDDKTQARPTLAAFTKGNGIRSTTPRTTTTTTSSTPRSALCSWEVRTPPATSG